MPETRFIYSGACGNCDERFSWALVSDKDDLEAIPPAVVTIGHLCSHPAQDVALMYEGECSSLEGATKVDLVTDSPTESRIQTCC